MDASVVSYLPLWAVSLPLLATIPLYVISQKSAQIRDWFSIIIASISFVMVLGMYPVIRAGQIIYLAFPNLFPPFGISFMVDSLGFAVALISSFVWLLCIIYSKSYMAHEHGCNRFYPFLLLCLGGCLGVVMTGDLFSLFVFFELMSLASYVLIIHAETPTAMRAGYKYLMLTLVGGLALFFAISITYEISGTVSLVSGHLFPEASKLAFTAFIAYVIGFGMKMGIVPLHVWLPDAHPVAPSGASALLSGVMLKTGAYGMLRVTYEIYGVELIASAGWDNVLLVIAGVTIFLGSALAIIQMDLKRRLAYSSISQMGYILLGTALLNESGLIGSVYHIFSHAMMKSTLFLAAGAIIFKTGKRDIRELKGIGFEMPITMGCFTIAALAMIGIPPLNGFVSKTFLSLGALDAGQFFYAFLLIVSSLMNGVYYLPIIIAAFFGERPEVARARKKSFLYELAPSMMVPMMLLAAGIFLSGLMPDNFILELSRAAARFLLRG
ncbi:MAG: proton-conducting transporter membrane subunit [Bacillota bacterium]